MILEYLIKFNLIKFIFMNKNRQKRTKELKIDKDKILLNITCRNFIKLKSYLKRP